MRFQTREAGKERPLGGLVLSCASQAASKLLASNNTKQTDAQGLC